MEQDIQKQIAASRKGMGDYTRLILAFYVCLLLLGVYQQISLYSAGILDSVAGSNLIILAAHHLGFTALISLFLYFAFNAMETLRTGMGLYVTAIILAGALFVEGGLTAYFVTRFEMPGVGFQAFPELNTTSATTFLPVVTVLLAAGFTFFGLYKCSAPLQMWMGRIYPFTLAVFSLFLATLLAKSAPISENKTKYLLADWYQKATRLHDPAELYRLSDASLEPLEELYQREEARIWDNGQNDTGALEFPGSQPAILRTGGLITDPFSNAPTGVLQYPKAGKKELLRIRSTFRGGDFDKAYEMARELAYEGRRDQSMELCQFILSEVPEYVDAEILLGRILSWEGEFARSAAILEGIVRKHPYYEDAYAALLDTYYWSGNLNRGKSLQPFINRHFKTSKTLQQKLRRVEETAQKTL